MQDAEAEEGLSSVAVHRWDGSGSCRWSWRRIVVAFGLAGFVLGFVAVLLFCALLLF